MATTAYWNWVSDGRPWKVMRPIKALGDRLRRYGYTVYYLGSDDTSHLQARTPQDHCPFSATGWPGSHPYPWVAALDIMPPRAGSGLPSLQQLGAQIVADRQAGAAGVGWLKYINWEPDRDNGGRCWQDLWKPNHVRVNSSDRGHIHMSARADAATSTAGDDYDPVARLLNRPAPASTEGHKPMYMVQAAGDPTVYVSDGLRRRHIDWDTFVFFRDVLGLKTASVPGADALDRRGGPLDKTSVPVELTGDQLRSVEQAARDGADDGAGPTVDQIRRVVREEIAARFAEAGDIDDPAASG